MSHPARSRPEAAGRATRHRRAARARTLTGSALLAAGFLLWLWYHVTASGEAHSYTDGEAPPRSVQLHAADRYVLGYPGGLPAIQRAGVRAQALRCTAVTPTGGSTVLQLAVEPDGTKATDQIASFRAPGTGRVHVACQGLPAVYVDNASGDPSGVLLVAATVLLALGAPIALSGARGMWPAARRPVAASA